MLVTPPAPSLPIVDVSPFVQPLPAHASAEQRQEHAARKAQTARDLDSACRTFGFFYLVGHGLSESDMAAIRSLAKEFFELPPEEKELVSIAKTDLARGYQRLGQNITQYAKDWHEGFDLYAPVGPDHTIRKRGLKTLAGTNPIPARPENFEPVVNRYVQLMRDLGMATMRAMAVGLGLDETYFDPYMNDSFWVMRLIGYPPLSQGSDGVGISCGEHTDYGCLTILNTDETTGALQVKAKSGEWINADPVPGAFVINIGDMVNVWTNGLYTSTLHRVVHTKSSFRVSVPFFFEPNFDATIAPLPQCIAATGKQSYHPVMYGDHLLSKVTNNFDVSTAE
ncbi:hypothetical protein BC831DRAFT_454729 [Entophlyctis helioformis]|nr:hypothetical protein BC831DRAFT_454729 [Entophlyctis helioformis]